MGTGDLDGDLYWINWNPNFVDHYKEAAPNKPEKEKNTLDFLSNYSSYLQNLREDCVTFDEVENRK